LLNQQFENFMQIDTISKFNHYLGVMPAKNNNIDLGNYEENSNLRLKSGLIYPNFYRISLKYDLNNFLDTIVKAEECHKGFIQAPNKPFLGKLTNLGKDIIST